MKCNKLLTLTTRFENPHTLVEESLSDFYSKLGDIVNKSFALGEKIHESMLVRKIIRLLPNRFQSKIITIEENKNLDTMKMEELMVSLRAFDELKTKEKGENHCFQISPIKG